MRKTLILLALVVVTASSVGCCGGRCRNLFRRGSPCLGTATVAPAMMGGPMAIAAPVQAPAVQPMVMPQMIMQQPECCPQVPMCIPCDPCLDECSPCESGFQTVPGDYFGGGCQDCGPVTTYDPSYGLPGTELQQNVVPGDSGTGQDPRPTTQN